MTKYIAILRGINVGGKRKVLMADLTELLTGMGLKNVVTYIQSGNLVFDAAKPKANLDDKIAKLILEKYAFEVPVIVRTLEEWDSAIAENPFYDGKQTEGLHLTFLKEAPKAEKVNELQGGDFKPDDFAIKGREVFIKCAGRYSDTKLTNGFIEKRLKVTATTRNWITVLKLQELAG